MRKRLSRWCLMSVTVGGAVFVLAGTWRDPWLWTYAIVWSALVLYAMFSIDEDLAQERFHPPTAGADGVALHFVRTAALAHLVIGALDVGRWHLTASVPAPLRACALAAVAVTFGLFFRAMRENRFFSTVVRVQSDRDHRVIDTGPYAVRATSRLCRHASRHAVQRSGARLVGGDGDWRGALAADPPSRRLRGWISEEEPEWLRVICGPRQVSLDSRRLVTPVVNLLLPREARLWLPVKTMVSRGSRRGLWRACGGSEALANRPLDVIGVRSFRGKQWRIACGLSIRHGSTSRCS